MAQIIQLPLSVEFTPEKRMWEVCTATLTGPIEGPPQASGLSSLPIGRFEKAEVSIVRSSLTGFTRAVARATERYSIGGYVSEHGALMNYFRGQSVLLNAIYGTDPSLELFVSFESNLKKVRPADPWKMREEFLALPRKMTALGKFLNRWGAWDGVGIRKVDEGTGLLGLAPPPTQFVVPHVIWELQTRFRAALSGDPEEWLSQNGRIPAPQRAEHSPHFTIKHPRCLSAIETTITLDKIRDVPYRVCERSDCGMVFKLESNHARQFCSQPCAHLVSVRRGREAKRNNKKQGEL